MSLLDQFAKRAADRLPSVVGATAHSVADYTAAAVFILFGLTAWRKNGRVAISSFACALFLALTSAVTDYPGGLTRKLPFTTHGRMDIGLGALVAALPAFMGFEKLPESRFFRLQAVAIATMAGLTDFLGTGQNRQLRHLDRAA